VARTQGPGAQKASADRISDCGFRISDFLGFFFNPHSAIGIPQFGGGPVGDPPDRPYADSTRGHGSGVVPARSMESKAPYGFCAPGPCARAWHPGADHLPMAAG